MLKDASPPDYDQYVRLLANRDGQPIAKAALLSGGKPAITALIRGMAHPNPKMRVWCTALLDHMEADWDESCVQAVIERLDDEVPRVRIHALHALSCQTCHPTLPDLDVVAPLLKLATSDPSIRVRRAAVRHLALLPYDSRIVQVLTEQLVDETDSILRSRIAYAIQVHAKPSRPNNCPV